MGAPQVHLKDQRIQAGSFIHDVHEGGIGYAATIPIVFAVDFYGRETGRQCAGSHDVLGADHHVMIVEENEVARAHIGGAQR